MPVVSADVVELAADLMNAGTGDRALDRRFHKALFPASERSAPAYSGSFDVTLAAFEKRLPGWQWLRKAPGSITVYDPPDPTTKEWATHIDGRHAVPAIALMIATLWALSHAGKKG